MTGPIIDELVLICTDLPAPPLFGLADDLGQRRGYEPAVADLLAEDLGVRLRWKFHPWSGMLPGLASGDAHGVLCGQGISPERQEVADFTSPYAVFDESVLIRRGDPLTSAAALRGRRVGAIAGSINLKLAQTFDGAIPVPFDGATDDVFGDMVGALDRGEIDAVVDDDVALLALGDDQGFQVAFTVPTRNPWGIAVAKGRADLRDQLNHAIAAVKEDGRLKRTWQEWMHTLPYPF